MRLTGESVFVSAISGTSQKTGKAYCRVKFLDEQADEFFTAYVDASMYESLMEFKKHTPVILTLNLVPGQSYFTLESIELIKK